MNKIRVGITGYSGFIGYYLSTHIQYLTDDLIFVPCPNDFFEDENKLSNFVKQCDIIVHLAAMNRGNAKEIFETNIYLVNQLVGSLENDMPRKHVIYASSIQTDRDNAYGRSKIKGEEILEAWVSSSGSTLTTLVIPNVFGAFCKPFHNSVISTFCHQLIHNEEPEIHINAEIEFIYVGNLIEEICKLIESQDINNKKIFIKSGKRKSI